MSKAFLGLCALIAWSACASSPGQEAGMARPSGLDPVGTYDFTTAAEGTEVTGAITITTAAAGGYTGTITTSITEPIPVTSVTVEGQTMNVTAETPDGQLTMTLVFTGNDFTGNWSLGGGQMTGVLSGRRRVG